MPGALARAVQQAAGAGPRIEALHLADGKKLRGRIGVVLSGGGVFGGFQAGALHTLRESGVEFASLAGTSIGAFNAVMGSSHWVAGLEQLFLHLPADVEAALAESNRRWGYCLQRFDLASEVIAATGWRGSLSSAGMGAITGALLKMAIGPAVVAGLTATASVPAAAVMGGALAGGSVLAHRYVRAVRGIADLMAALEDEGPMVSPLVTGFIRELVGRAWAAGQTGTVHATLSAPILSARALLGIATRGTMGVGAPGEYRQLSGPTAGDHVVASTSIPYLFGRNNAINPTTYFDGGLFDDVPVAALVPVIAAGELDALMVIDVVTGAGRSSAALVASRLGGLTVPTLVVHLPSVFSGSTALRTLIDFGRARDLFRAGAAAGRQALEAWF